MGGRGRLLLLIAFATVVVVPSAAAVAQDVDDAGQGGAKADAAVQVTASPDQARAHAVPAVAVHPQRSGVIAIVEGEAFSGRCSVNVSTDAGLTWTASALPQDPSWPSCVYANFGPIADVTFAADGTLYVAFSGADPTTYQSRIFLARSSDLGRTFAVTTLPWVEPDLAAGEFGADALPSVAVDPKDPQKVYVGWMSNNGTWNHSEAVLGGKEYFYDIRSRPYVVASSDGGKTFSQPVDMAGDRQGWMSEPYLAVGAAGELLAVFGENVKAPKDAAEGAKAPPAHLWLASSVDGGHTFTQEALHTRPPRDRSDYLSGPSIAVAPEAGELLVVWEETADGSPKVVFTRSADGGASWSEPLTLNDVAPDREWKFNEFFPALSVAPTGRIDVAWYDWRNDPSFDAEAEEPSNTFQDVYYTFSTDGGRSWAPNVRVTDRSIDRSVGVAESYGVKGKVGLASTDAAAYLAWDDTRNGDEEAGTQDVYFTRVRFGAPDAVFAPAASEPAPPIAAALLGAATALALGGLVLFVGVRVARKGTEVEATPEITATG